MHPSLASLGGQRLEAGFPGAGTHAGDQLHTAAQLVGSDRPSTLPLFEKLSLDDATMRVAHGFKGRPLRHRGGKTSPGRVPPHKRIGPYASPLGRFIKRKALPLVSDFAASTAAGAKQHPFPETVLKEIREFILPEHSQPAAGQPFFLDLIRKLLWDIQDVDSDYPETLKEGVPLGVDTPTLQSPGVWPLKSKLIGEEWDPIEAPPPVHHSNYPSANTFREEIRANMLRRPPCGWSLGNARDRKRQRTAVARKRTFVHARWQASMNRTKSVPSLMTPKGEQIFGHSRTR